MVGEGMDSGDKASNKALAVAFKYACFQVFCIPTEEMKDPDEESHEPSTSRRPVLVDDVHISTLFTELSRTGIGRNQMLKNYGITDIHEMTMEQFRDAMNILKGKPDKPLDPATVPPDDMDGRMPWNTPTR